MRSHLRVIATVLSTLCLLGSTTACPPTCATGEKDDISSWSALSSAFITVPANRVACIGIPFSGGIQSGQPLSLTHFITDARKDGSIVLEGIVPDQSQGDVGLTSFGTGSPIRIAIADCPQGDFTIDSMVPVAPYTTMDVPYATHAYSRTTYDSATDPSNTGNGHFAKLTQNTAFCFNNASTNDVRVLFEAFLPNYSCIPASRASTVITAASAKVQSQSCPVVVKTCDGSPATAQATNRVVPIVDDIGCGNTWVAFANDDDEAKHCAMLAGAKPVDDLCTYDVELYNDIGAIDTDVVSDSSADAITCAQFGPSGCTNCSPTVLSMGSCLSGSR